jgi:catechol 2,3-dioxygenase-like lactoylglutathione lyase family enzyme
LGNSKASIQAQISWVYTEDLDASTQFYSGVLGLECTRDAGDARVFATGHSAGIGVCCVFADRVIEPSGSMISIVTDDVDAWYRRLLARDLVLDPPQRLDSFGIYSLLVHDPNGYVIEFQQFDS